MVIPGSTRPVERNTELQARFIKHRHEFNQIFKKQLANFWRGPQLGFDPVKFRKALDIPVEATIVYFVHSKFGDRALAVIKELLGE